MASAIGGLTIEDFEQLPDALAHNKELVDGELVDVSGNIGYHIALREALSSPLYLHVRQHRLERVLSEQEFEFGKNVHGPDISFFGPPRISRPSEGRTVRRQSSGAAIRSRPGRRDRFTK